MWYTVGSDTSTIRDEGESGCRSTYRRLREIFRLPPLDVVIVGLSGDLTGLMEWSRDAHVNVLPFTFEKDRRIRFDLVPKKEGVVVGSVWYGASKILNATFNRSSDARDILGMFYQHSLIFYGPFDSQHAATSIREILEP